MVHKLASCLALFLVVYADPEDKNWVWGDNNRETGRNAGLRQEASARYEIYENDDLNSYPVTGNGFGVGPVTGQFPGPILNKPGNIPDGIYNVNNQLYGEGHGQYYPNDRPGQGILGGQNPSFHGEGPYKEFDRCKCTERFNCNSPGISYGHCDVGKRYCCYSTTKKGQAGGPLPSRPVHSIENGILVGPGGPVGGNNFQRPVGGFGEHGRPVGGYGEHDRPVGGFGQSVRPGGYGGQVRPGGFGGSFRPGVGGFGGRPGSGGFGLGGQNLYSPNQGILVGPGGPSNRPNFGFSPRSAIDKKD